MKLTFLLMSLLFSSTIFAQEKYGDDLYDDFTVSIKWLLQASYKQFGQRSSLYLLPPAVGATWYGFEHDDRIVSNLATKEARPWHSIPSDASVAASFPFIPLSFYYIGRSNSDAKMVRFAMEYTSAMYLALGEAALLSFIDVHERPEKTKTTFWETAFRGDSSWPSGHIVPFSTLFFKTLQFYGPYWSVIPGVLAFYTGYERIMTKKHYASDVIAGFFLAAFASEGVRAASGYKKNHPFYKWVFESDGQLGISRVGRSWGPKVSWTF